MFKIRFISARFWLLLIVCTIFIKIYQYNMYIKTTYEYQRLGTCFARVERERNELLVVLYEHQQPIKLMHGAEKHGMQPIQLDLLVSATQVALVDFIGTTSTVQVLEQCGISIVLPDKKRAPLVVKQNSLILSFTKNSYQALKSSDMSNDLSAIADRLATKDSNFSMIAFGTINTGDLGDFIVEKV